MRHLSVPLLRHVLGKHFADVALMEEFLRGSDLDWTVLRVPRVVDAPATGRVRTAYGRPLRAAFRIGRADAAQVMLRLAGQPETAGTVVTAAD
ncbi:hypothetical protein HD597_003547 [Nonomuraea thailandensis]|uniref:NAD(P)-binding domain-containing protein n=1 Tax=Nonomuraea thailandensis TaxID=1188745 RepID=A0A9X2K0Q7_9ACTN|nr:NAD(P)H-binding protein [Nonomuraea thailandensis]MCP2356527.1 hypothetical protein [Nonomuraea thailandensis]